MSLGYMMSATSFAILCSMLWLVLGHSVFSAFTLYLFSGQMAILALIGRAALRYNRAHIHPH